MPYQNNLDGLGSLHPPYDVKVPGLDCVTVETIWSQKGNSYVQIVDLANVDDSMSLLPPGVSEDPASPHFKDQLDLWVDGQLHPAPLMRQAVEKYRESSLTLDVPDGLSG